MKSKAFDVAIWKDVLPRVRKLYNPNHTLHKCLFHSTDMDRYLDSDNPEETPATTTIRHEIKKLGINKLIRIPESSGLGNYLEIDHYIESGKENQNRNNEF